MAPRAETFQRTRADEWLFATVELRLSGSELTAVLALHPHMDAETLEAFPGLPRMAALAGCEVRKITRGLAGLIGRGVLTKRVGGGRGNLTIYQGVIAAPETGSRPSRVRPGSNPSSGEVSMGASRKSRDPVSDAHDPETPGPATTETGSKTGSETGSAPRAPAIGKGKVEQSTRRFAPRGPTASVSVGPGAEEKLRDFAWRIAKAFPSKRGGLPQAATAIRAFVAEGSATREEIETGLRAWLPWFASMLAENGDPSGYTMRGWLESGAFREEPSVLHNWTPEVSGIGGREFP